MKVTNKFYTLIGFGQKGRMIKTGETGCIEAIKRKQCSLLIIAENASENTKKKFVNLCSSRNIKYIVVSSKEELGNAIGRELCATIAVCEKKFSRAVLGSLEVEE